MENYWYNVPAVPDGGVISTHAAQTGVTVDYLVQKLLHEVVQITAADQRVFGTKPLVFVPPHPERGPYGPVPCDVLVINRSIHGDDLQWKRTLSSARVGPVLKNILDEIGIDYHNWVFTNAIWFPVPNEKPKDRHISECRSLLAETINLCQPKFVLVLGAHALKAYLSIVDPGKSSKLSLKNVRGAVMEHGDIKAMATVHPTAVFVDPSASQSFKNDIWAFCDLVKGELKDPSKSVKIYELDSLDDLNAWVDSMIAEKVTRFAVDTEYGDGNWMCGRLRTIQIAWSPDEVVVIILRRCEMVPAFRMPDGSMAPDGALELLKRLFYRPGVVVDGHNMRGDLHWLREYGLDIVPQFIDGGFDTMLGHHLMFEADEQQLELVASKLMGYPRYDLPLRQWLVKNGYGENKRKKLEALGYRMIPDDILHPYSGHDAIVTFRLSTRVRNMLERVPALNALYYETVHPATLPIMEMEQTGILSDQELLRVQSIMFAEKQVELLENLRQTFNWPEFNPRSVDHVKALLFGYRKIVNGVPVAVAPPGATVLNLTPTKSTDDTDWAKVVADGAEASKSPSTDSESLGILSAEHPELKELQKFKFIDQIVKNFVASESVDEETGEAEYTKGLGAVIWPDRRFHCSIRQTLETGRYAASSPNTMNLPKKQEAELHAVFVRDGVVDPRYRPLRNIFVASPGCVIVAADWNQAELWTLGYLSGDTDYVQTLRTSDLHTEMLKKCFGVKKLPDGKIIDGFTVKELNKLRKRDDPVGHYLEALRTCAKTVNFGVNYSRGGAAVCREVLRQGVKCTPVEASSWIETFFNTYRGVAKYLAWCKEQVLDPGYLINPFGRVRHAYASGATERGTLAALQREFCNFPIQSSVGDAMSRALVNFWWYKREINPKCQYHIILSVHDAVLLEVPFAHVEEVVRKVVPLCMTDNVELSGTGLHYSVGQPLEIQYAWGAEADPERLLSDGIPRDLCGFET